MPVHDLLETILRGTPPELEAARQRVTASRGKGDRALVARAERAVAAEPSTAISVDGEGWATVTAAGRTFSGGRFALRSIRELRESVATKATGTPGTVTLSVIEGDDPVTDIGALQAQAPASTLFQAASQFNCLESPGPYLVDVASYLSDPTQGPRASISAFPGTLVRHYAAPDGEGGRFVQTQERQLDLLARALPAAIGRVESGYLQLSRVRDVPGAASALESNFEQIRVGVHDGAQVVLGHAWDGGVEGEPRIAQVFTSTLAAGGYGGGEAIGGPVQAICRQLLRAAYLGTLLAALDLGKGRVVLTMIGGGVFGNPHQLICECVIWAVEEAQRVASAPLEVVLNSRDLASSVDRRWLEHECRRLGGALCSLAGW
jgi:hypothetical protein